MKFFKYFFLRKIENLWQCHSSLPDFYLTCMHRERISKSEAEKGGLARWVAEQLRCLCIRKPHVWEQFQIWDSCMAVLAKYPLTKYKWFIPKFNEINEKGSVSPELAGKSMYIVFCLSARKAVMHNTNLGLYLFAGQRKLMLLNLEHIQFKTRKCQERDEQQSSSFYRWR